jgi:hypothetical protein
MSAIYKDLQFVTQAKKIANDFIEKPFKEIELIRKINKLLPSEDDIIPPSPSYMVSMEAEKSKEMSDKMESDLVVEVNKTEIQPGSNKITIDIPTHEPEMLKESQPTGERAEEGGEPTKEFHIHLQDAENNQDEESNEEIKVSKAILDSTTSHKKSQSIESIQKELDALFKMTKKK